MDAQEFRMCGENRAAETPLVGAPYEVWGLPERRITAVRSHKWHEAARLVGVLSITSNGW